MFVITPMSGRAIAQSAAISPDPRMPISAINTSVSGSRRVSVSGSPISLLCPSSAATVRATGRQSAARMSFVEVFPLEPVIATTRASLRSRTGAPERGHRAELVVGHERRRCAARASLVQVCNAASERDEQIARPDAARVDLDAGDGRGVSLHAAEGPQRVECERDHVRGCQCPQRVARRLAVVEGDGAVRQLLTRLGALSRDQHDVVLAGDLDRARNRRGAIGLDVDLARPHPRRSRR